MPVENIYTFLIFDENKKLKKRVSTMIIEIIMTTLMCARYDEIYPLSNNVQMSSYIVCRPRVKILWK